MTTPNEKIPPHQRPTLRQLAALSAEGDPWACPRCGCKDWRTSDSRPGSITRNRIRVCRNCHTPIYTQEIPVPRGHKLIIIPEDMDHAKEDRHDQ